MVRKISSCPIFGGWLPELFQWEKKSPLWTSWVIFGVFISMFFWQKGQPTEGRGSTSCKRPTIHFSVNGYHHTRGLATVSIVHLRLGVEPTPTLGPGHKNHRKKNPHAQHAPGPEAFVRRKLGNPKRGFGRGDVCMKQTWNKNDA